MFDDITGSGNSRPVGKTPVASAKSARQSISAREAGILKAAFYWRKRFDEACPDVGMGPSDAMLLKDIENQIGIILTDDERKQVIG